jgi:hypothetical protein
MSVRGFEFESTIESTCPPLISRLHAAITKEIHCLRDITWGGLSAALNELVMLPRLVLNLKKQRFQYDPESVLRVRCWDWTPSISQMRENWLLLSPIICPIRS